MNAMDRILELTDAVERQIETGDWLSARETDAERRRLLVAMLEANDLGRLASDEQQCLREILQRTDAAIAEVGQLKGELAAASRRLRTAPRALRSYRQNTGPDARTLLRE